MAQDCIGNNAVTLTAIPFALMSLLPIGLPALRRSWRIWGLGFCAFCVPLCLFLATAILDAAGDRSATALFIAGSATLGVMTPLYGIALILLWRNKELAGRTTNLMGPARKGRRRWHRLIRPPF